MVHLKDVLTRNMIVNVMNSTKYNAQDGQGTSQTGYKNVTYNGKNGEHLQMKFHDSNPNPGTYHFVGILPTDFCGENTPELCGRLVEYARMNGCKNTQELADALCKDKTLNANVQSTGKTATTPVKNSSEQSKIAIKGKAIAKNKGKQKTAFNDKNKNKSANAGSSDTDDMNADQTYRVIKTEAKLWKNLEWISEDTYDQIKQEIKEMWVIKKREEMNSDSDSD